MTVSAPPTSLSAAALPPRVHRTLERLLALLSEELDAGLDRMLLAFERELFRLADLARNPGSESDYMQAVRSFRPVRADLIPHTMLALEAALAALRTPDNIAAAPAPAPEPVPKEAPSFRNLSLLDDSILDERTVLREIASRQEGRATLELHLLGQRFGVLAGTPAFDAERLPVGPQGLCRAISHAATALALPFDARILLYRMFDRHVMAGLPQLMDRMNDTLAQDGILPALTFVPMRNQRPPSPLTATPADTGEATEPAPVHTGWLGQATLVPDAPEDNAAFGRLRQLLAGRQALIGKLRTDAPAAKVQALHASELDDALQALGQQASPAARESVLDIKRTILAQARQQRGQAATLAPQDNDTFELLGLLYAQLQPHTRADAPTAPLLGALQVPLLQLALKDPGFFLHAQHPARQLLNTVAESAAQWMERDELDPALIAPLQQAVDEVARNRQPDAAAFARANATLQSQVQAQVRRVEMLERRHVEAARGKEKLEVARQQAGQMLDDTIGGQPLPPLARTLLGQAWRDVLTLTLLRQGGQSDAWQAQCEATAQIVAACSRPDADTDPQLAAHVQSAMAQVGYHDEDAARIAQHLTGNPAQPDGQASRTELAMRLKQRSRLGEDKPQAQQAAPPARTPAEDLHFQQLCQLPFGTWIEFDTDTGTMRRRLSWYSRMTGHALFVNQRGQRVDERSLDSLARDFAAGRARLVSRDRAGLVDRAWQAAMGALRSFAGRSDAHATGEHP